MNNNIILEGHSNLGIDFNRRKPEVLAALGSSSTSSAVVQSTKPAAAIEAGMIGSNAAQVASQEATQAIDTAINEVNTQYTYAQAAVQPYETSGVAALDQLNQYLGLPAYNPGNAPTAPTYYTAADEAKNVSQQDINQYIQQNESYNPQGTFGYDYTYTGAGSNLVTTQNNHNGQGQTLMGATQGINALMGDNMSNPIVQTLAQQDATQANSTYGTEMAQYNQNLNAYNSNLADYNKYAAEGPLNQQQITQNITNLPGYQSLLSQGTAAINNDAAAKGYLGSGLMLKELMNFGQNSLAQFYGNTLSQLANVAGMGQQAANTQSNSNQNQANALATLNTQLGTTQANATLSGANSLSQALIAANQQFNTIQTGSSTNNSGVGSAIGALAGLF